uniref:Ig-like domain-containing protein n=1 Tax=Neolamprologus brichardi TaxID=32507 RepID=A0A3Q4H352_NEOBR
MKTLSITALADSDPVIKRPGESHRLTYTASGFTFSGYWMAWMREAPGKGLEWIGFSSPDGTNSLKNKFSISLDSSSNTVTLNGQNVQPEDTAVYYCARDSHIFIYGINKGQGLNLTDTRQMVKLT